MIEHDSYIDLPIEIIQLIPAEEANHFRIVPQKLSERHMFFYADKSKSESELADIKKELTLLHDREIKLTTVAPEIIDKSLAIHYRQGETDSISKRNFGNSFLEDLLDDAVRTSASDIHIEIFEEGIRVRFRIDGGLVEKMKMPTSQHAEIVNQVKIRARLNITEKRRPQDGRIQLKDFDVRVSILPTKHGEKIVMRLLRREKGQLILENLGFSENDLKQYYSNINKPNGIILISGPTGSGKTTTLYATLQYLNKLSRNILTVEDPIEYTISGINQVQINDEIGLNFAAALRSFLRQDPDIIMLGEIRDAETAKMAIRASLTGHLVLSTIHTNSSVGTISRLQDMDIPGFLIAETLNISIAQRLVRLLCKNCRSTSPEKLKDTYNSFVTEYDIEVNENYHSKGCPQCYYTGFLGRTAIYELLTVDNNLIDKIKKGESLNKSGWKNSLGYQALELVKSGETSFEEVYPILLNQR